MANIFVKVAGALKDVGEWVADAVKVVLGLTSKVENVLKAAKTLEQPFISALGAVVGDVEALVTQSEGAATSAGLNFAADSQVYQTFLKLVTDAKTLVPIAQEALAILEGKSATAPAAPAAATPAPTDAKVIVFDPAQVTSSTDAKTQLSPGVVQHT